ncbi:MAG TPA: hypothetical protein VMR76_00245 [Candidatus Saccharimonadia bacterium]|nr:hypothetical protein [Candidatus Saccharimonadia bacterium]
MAEKDDFISGEDFKSLNYQKGKNNGSYNKIILLAVGLVIYSVLLFYLGTVYQNHHNKTLATTSTTINGNNRSPFGSNGGGRFGANRLFGDVTAIGSSSITVSNTRTNTSSTINITSSTTITENQQSISLSSISVGQTVIIALDPSNTNNATSLTVVNFSGPSQSSSSTPSSN